MSEKQESYELMDWEVLAYDCVNCNYRQETDCEQDCCCNCGSEDIYHEWNYEDMKCCECDDYIEIDEPIHAKIDGEFEDILCDSCYRNL